VKAEASIPDKAQFQLNLKNAVDSDRVLKFVTTCSVTIN